jgi:hypothetical protein
MSAKLFPFDVDFSAGSYTIWAETRAQAECVADTMTWSEQFNHLHDSQFTVLPSQAQVPNYYDVVAVNGEEVTCVHDTPVNVAPEVQHSVHKTRLQFLLDNLPVDEMGDLGLLANEVRRLRERCRELSHEAHMAQMDIR